MENLPISTDVLVVGAGPTGLMLAVELTRRGIDCLLIDEVEAPSTFIKGSVVSSRTLEIFEELGIFEEACKLGTVVHAVVLWAEGRRAMTGDMALLDAPHAYNLHLGQPYTEQLLTTRLLSEGGSIHRQVRLADFDLQGDRVVASLEVPGGECKLQAKWIVGCDGAHSTVRQKLGFHLEGQTYPVDYMLANLKIEWNQPHDEIQLFFTREGSFTVNPLPDGLMQVAGDLPHEEGDNRTRTSPTLQDVQELFDRRVAIPARLYEPRRLVYYRSHRRQVVQRVMGRAILAGDAAHLVSPQTGLGMNTGLQDSWNLGWKLAAVVTGEADASLLESYQEERQAVLGPLAKMSDTDEMLYSLQSRVAQELRDHVVMAALHFEPFWRRNVRDITQIGVNYRGLSSFDEYVATPLHLPGKHVVESGHCTKAWMAFGRGPRAGERVPDARPVTRDGLSNERLLPFVSRGQHMLLLFAAAADPSKAVCEAFAECAALARKWLDDHVCVELVVPSDAVPEACRQIGADRTVFDVERAAHDRFGALAESVYFCRCDGFVGFRSLPPNAEALGKWFDKVKFVAS